MRRGRWMQPGAVLGVVAVVLLVPGGTPVGQPDSEDIAMSPISGDPDRPRRHYRLRDARGLTDAQASDIYAIVRGALAKGYARSGRPAATHYQTWQLHNRAPYRSSTHGNHYLNNYTNERAAAYGKFEQAGTLPVGAVISKDSFSMTETGEILLGPLFVMEKMPDGFSHATGDWKYSVVLPDGTLLGETRGTGAERVEYCIACHLAREEHDHLYFVPERYRVQAPGRR